MSRSVSSQETVVSNSKRTTYFGDIVVTSCSRRHVQSVSTWGDDHSQFPLVTGAATFETLRAPCFLQDVRYGSLLAKQHLQLLPVSFRILGHTPEELDPRRYTCSLFEKFQGQVVWHKDCYWYWLQQDSQRVGSSIGVQAPPDDKVKGYCEPEISWSFECLDHCRFSF